MKISKLMLIPAALLAFGTFTGCSEENGDLMWWEWNYPTPAPDPDPEP